MVNTTRGTVTPTLTRVLDVAARHEGEERWAEVLFADGRNRVVLISAPPGTPPDPHLHPGFNEWWIVMAGEISWQIGEYEPVLAKQGDIIIAPCGFRHDIRPRGDVQTMRLGVTHYYGNHNLKGVAPSRLVPVPDVGPPNLIHTSLSRLLRARGENANWSQDVVLDTRNRAAMIHELPGTENPLDTAAAMVWWAVLKGRLEWRIGDDDPITVGPGSLVFVEPGIPYRIATTGNEPSVRVSVARPPGA